MAFSLFNYLIHIVIETIPQTKNCHLLFLMNIKQMFTWITRFGFEQSGFDFI